MFQSLPRAVALAVVGALAGAACLAAQFAAQPVLTLDMDRDLPRVVTSGFHAPERAGDETFAWTTASAVIRLPGFHRRQPWSCAVRMRGGRGPELAQPVVTLAVDGISGTSLMVTNDYQSAEIAVPPQPARPGLTLSIASSQSFVPGPGDRRELGVQIDRVDCRPTGSGFARPTARALTAAAASGAAFGAAFGLLAVSAAAALGATLLLACAQTLPLASGLAPYAANYLARGTWLAVAIAGCVSLAALLARAWNRAPLSAAAAGAMAFTAGALFVQLLALLHPSKPIIDALFHAHRLEWVLDGRYFFTQIMPDGVRFPYAIGLYVFSAPWTLLATDHVALLRIVVSVVHSAAGLMLYPVVARCWGDRRAGLLAVVLYHLVPLPYLVIGNANMTFAFGQAVAVMAMAAAVALPVARRGLLSWMVLFLLALLAFLSHVGVFPLLASTLVAAGGLYWWRGGPTLRRPGLALALAAILAAIVSVVAYYGQFGEAYETLNRVRGRAADQARPAPATEQEAAVAPRGVPPEPLSRPVRLVRALSQGTREVGWPLVILAALGAWQVWRAGARDRLGLALAAWGLAYAAFVLFSVATPVEPRFQRYTDEFISRVTYATLPAVVILAARGAAWGWSAGRVLRLVSAVFVLAAFAIAAQRWAGWIA